MARLISTSPITKQIVTGFIGQWCRHLGDNPQPREINFTIDLDASHCLYIIYQAIV